MFRAYGTPDQSKRLNRGLKSAATIWIEPMALSNNSGPKNDLHKTGTYSTSENMFRAYGTPDQSKRLNRGLKSAATIWIEPTALSNNSGPKNDLHKIGTYLSSENMFRAYGTPDQSKRLNRGSKSAATIWIEPMAVVMSNV